MRDKRHKMQRTDPEQGEAEAIIMTIASVLFLFFAILSGALAPRLVECRRIALLDAGNLEVIPAIVTELRDHSDRQKVVWAKYVDYAYEVGGQTFHGTCHLNNEEIQAMGGLALGSSLQVAYPVAMPSVSKAHPFPLPPPRPSFPVRFIIAFGVAAWLVGDGKNLYQFFLSLFKSGSIAWLSILRMARNAAFLATAGLFIFCVGGLSEAHDLGVYDGLWWWTRIGVCALPFLLIPLFLALFIDVMRAAERRAQQEEASRKKAY